jgi:hypothetical protein
MFAVWTILSLVVAGIYSCGPGGSTIPVTTPASSLASSSTPLASTPNNTVAILPTSATTPLTAAPSAAELAAQQFALPNIPRLTVEQTYALRDSNTPPVLVDVRAKESYNYEHIPGARNIPNNGGEVQLVSAESLAQLKLLPKDRLLVFYCD